MPVTIQRTHRLIRMAGKISGRRTQKAEGREARLQNLRVALVNNMPDAALEDTEQQFAELLEAAAVDTPIHLSLFSLPEVPRGARGRRRIAEVYNRIEELWNSRFDAAIVTGTEPRQPDLRQEPYWKTFTQVMDWAEENTRSVVLSCLAAHAGVLHRDGIERHRLAEKQFGVFEYESAKQHFLMQGAANRVCIPHSRWNEVKQPALEECGYEVLTYSRDAGADLFVKKRKRSLVVHFQGHPEYGAKTLLKEYRRDVKRFIRGDRETYPAMPHGYFDAEASNLMIEFREKVHRHKQEGILREFPEAAVAARLHNSWRPSAVAIYRNWLRFVAFREAVEPAQFLLAGAGRA